MAKILVQVLVPILLVLVAGAGATPPGIAKNPSHATCKIKKYKHCYNLVHVCPKFCPDGCTVECASCKPICVGGANPPPDSPTPTPTPSTPENPTPSPSTPENPPPNPPPTPFTPENPPPSTPSTPSTPENPPPTPSTPENPPPSTTPSTPSTPENPPPPSSPEKPPPTPSTPENPTPPSPSTPENPPPSPSPSTPSTPQNPTPSPSTPSSPENPPPSPSTPSSPENPPPSPTTPSPSTPENPPPSSSSPPSSPTPSTPSPTPSSPKTARCRNKNYPKCYNMEHVCPNACPGGCEVDCYTCKPVCKCDRPGAVCQDPRFIGGDGITFYFHGKKDSNFCLVSEPNLHINAHFIGRRNDNTKRDFTWVQSIAILFDNHQLFIGANKTATWDDSIDRLALSFDGEPITLLQSEGTTWKSSSVTIVREAGTNSVVVEVEGKLRVTAKVVPITEQDSRVHNYGITKEDCFAHLDLGFKFFSLSNEVSGVLGQTYKPNYVSRVNIGANMPVMGGAKEFETSSLFSPDCSVARFVGHSNNGVSILEDFDEIPGLSCASGIDGQGVVCRR